MLNDWDSLYKIIIILKKKFNQDNKFHYLSMLNLDIKMRDDAQISQEMEGVLSHNDKIRFHNRIQKLLNRDKRRKERRKVKAQ